MHSKRPAIFIGIIVITATLVSFIRTHKEGISKAYAQNSPTCLAQPGPRVTISGSQTSRYDARKSPLAANTVVDATTAVWTAQWPVQDSFNYPVILEGEQNVCFAGGTIQGNYPEQIGSDAHSTWDYTHSTAGMEVLAPNVIIDGMRIHNFGDGIRIKEVSQSFMIRNVRLSHMRDDCVSNDYLQSGTIENVFFDGCYTGFSTRPECTNCNGSNETVVIENSLFRMEPMQGVYKNRGPVPGHGAFFKWDTSSADISPKLILKNNVFRADQAGNAGLGLPKGKVVECANNTMVWLGSGPIPHDSSDQVPITEPINGVPCFTITTDKAVWENAAADWVRRHDNPNSPPTSVSPSPTTPISTISPSAASCPTLPQGDADCNGSVTLVDYDYYRRIVLLDSSVPPTISADFNGDGETGIKDGTILYQSLTS